jgi:hypothetical protein
MNRDAELREEADFRRQQREERYRRAVRLAQEGLCPSEISRRLGFSADAVRHALERAGVTYRRSTRDGALGLLPLGLP